MEDYNDLSFYENRVEVENIQGEVNGNELPLDPIVGVVVADAREEEDQVVLDLGQNQSFFSPPGLQVQLAGARYIFETVVHFRHLPDEQPLLVTPGAA